MKDTYILDGKEYDFTPQASKSATARKANELLTGCLVIKASR